MGRANTRIPVNTDPILQNMAMSKKQLARLINYSNSFVCRCFKHKLMTEDMIDSICNVLGIEKWRVYDTERIDS